MLSNTIDHLEGNNLLLLFATVCNPTIKNKINKEYKAKFVKVKLIYPNIGALKPIKLVVSNCSNGEFISNEFNDILCLYFLRLAEPISKNEYAYLKSTIVLNQEFLTVCLVNVINSFTNTDGVTRTPFYLLQVSDFDQLK